MADQDDCECKGGRKFPREVTPLPGGGHITSFASFPLNGEVRDGYFVETAPPGRPLLWNLAFNVRPAKDGTVLIGDWVPGREEGEWMCSADNERTGARGEDLFSDDPADVVPSLSGEDRAAFLAAMADPAGLLASLEWEPPPFVDPGLN